MAIIEGVTGPKVATAEYDFAVDGGAVSTISLRSIATDSVGAAIPIGAVILGGYVDVLTLLTTASGNTGTVAVNVEGAGDTVAAAVTSGAPWSTTGRKSVIPVFTGATTLKTTAARNIAITVAIAAVTAGKFRVVLMYI